LAELGGLFDALLGQAQQLGAVGVDTTRDIALSASLVRYANGRFVLEPRLAIQSGGRNVVSMPIDADFEPTLRSVQGRVVIERDPTSGHLLATPLGTETVRALPVLEGTRNGQEIALSGETLELGIDVRLIPGLEQEFHALGGGACSARWMADGSIFSLRVRAVMPTPVIPITLRHRRLLWNNSLYYARDPDIGVMRITNNPDFLSRTELFTRAPESDELPSAFFPASGYNQLYFRIEMVDLGVTCFNKEPMIQTYATTDWPPYATPLSIDRPVRFYDVADEESCLVTILSNDMQIYDYSSLDIEQVAEQLDADGRLRTTWTIRNQAREPAAVRWFVLGDHLEPGQTGAEGAIELGPAGDETASTQVNSDVQLSPSSLPQALFINAVSLGEPVLGGTLRRELTYPAGGDS
jgi:hypothetical protein